MPDTDRLVELGREHGWTVTDNRHVGTVWFARGPEYAHLGTDAAGDRVLSAHGGVHGRPTRFWAAGNDVGLGVRVGDRAAVLANCLTAEPYRFT
ncbi:MULTISPECIES: hypothetical protein [unclassified Mycobacterium]|uniref:hypothetical protein n=1 Tax=unclassified Mycobacterium TaxID=2642494 RepID=UPI0029C81A54|nr:MULTISPECIES: hypothetical protein [unclassified Mycobacterium]